MPAFLTKPVPNQEAIAFLKGKPAVAGGVFAGLLPHLRGRAFAVAGIESANLAQKLRDRIADLPAGADWDEIKGDLAKDLSPHLGGDEEESERRAELLLRSHGYQAYAAAQEQVIQRQADVFTHCQYMTAQDDRVRDAHAALDGVVLPTNDPFWETHTPPWDYGCRCQKVPLMAEDVEDIRAEDKDLPPESRRVIEGAALEQLRTGRLWRALPQDKGLARGYDVRAPIESGKAGGFANSPGLLSLSMKDLKQRYDAPVWANFERWARNTPLGEGQGNVWDWLEKAPSRERGIELPAPAPKAPRPRKEPAAPKPAEPEPVAGASPVEQVRRDIAGAAYKKEKKLGGRHINTALKLTNGKQVVFKPGAGERQSVVREGIVPGTQFKREVAASIIDETLGTNLVPPTAFVDYKGQKGSAQVFQDGFTLGEKLPDPYAFTGELTKRQQHDWHLLDHVLGHSDRHNGNFMARPRPAGGYDLAMIDNGLCLATSQNYPVLRKPAAGDKLDATDKERLTGFLAQEKELRARLTETGIEEKALDLMFGRAKALQKEGRFP